MFSTGFGVTTGPRSASLRPTTLWVAAVIPLLATVGTAQIVQVPAVANIFAAGHAFPEAPNNGGAGALPVLVNLPMGVGRTLLLSPATGQVSYCPPCGANGPDGTAQGSICEISAWRGISAFQSTQGRGLTGVFLTDDEPADPAPSPIVWNTGSIGSATIVAAPRQLFFVGDGLTGTGAGAVQEFIVPTTATRLYLGFADGFCGGAHGQYADNSGSLSTLVTLSGCLWLLAGPTSQLTCPSQSATFAVETTGVNPIGARWQWQLSPGANWVDATDGPLVIGASTWGTLAGSGTSSLNAQPDPVSYTIAPTLSFRCIVANSCGSVTSNPATLSICVGDFNCDGVVDGDDVIAFFAPWDASEIAADVTADGAVDGDDVIAFFGAWDNGC